MYYAVTDVSLPSPLGACEGSAGHRCPFHPHHGSASHSSWHTAQPSGFGYIPHAPPIDLPPLQNCCLTVSGCWNIPPLSVPADQNRAHLTPQQQRKTCDEPPISPRESSAAFPDSRRAGMGCRTVPPIPPGQQKEAETPAHSSAHNTYPRCKSVFLKAKGKKAAGFTPRHTNGLIRIKPHKA